MSYTFKPEAKCNRSMVRTLDWKLIRNDEKNGPTYELYDLMKDPGEIINQIKLNKEKAQELKEAMR